MENLKTLTRKGVYKVSFLSSKGWENETVINASEMPGSGRIGFDALFYYSIKTINFIPKAFKVEDINSGQIAVYRTTITLYGRLCSESEIKRLENF